MCEPVTIAMMAASAAKGAMQISSVNRSIESQAEGVAKQTQRAYAEANFETTQQKRAALEQGYAADISKRQSMGAARVRNAALGIRGATANENVAEQQRIGTFNTNTAKENIRKADAAYELGQAHTFAAAQDEQMSLQAQAPTMMESLVTIGASSLDGYLKGTAMSDSLSSKGRIDDPM